MRLPSALAITSAVLAVSASAAAQPNQSTTIAESLFRDGQSHLAAGDIAAACDLFARSQRVEGALGTLLNLASCHERDGKTATAWTEFQSAISWAVRIGDHAREQYGRAHVSALDGKLHRVVIEVLEPVEGTHVRLDGSPLPREALGTAIPLDPGEHTIEVSAPDKAPWLRKINLGPSSGTDRIEVKLEAMTAPVPEPALVPPPAAAEAKALPPVAPAASAPASTAPSGFPSSGTPGSPWTFPPAAGASDTPANPGQGPDGQKIAGYVVGGVGVAAVVTAIVLGVEMAQNTSDRDKLCPAGAPCDSQKAFADDHAARQDQQGMFITGGIGIVGLAAGAYLLLTSHHDTGPIAASPGKLMAAVHVDVTASSGSAGLRFNGRW